MFHRCLTLLPFLTLLRIPAAGAVAERANPERLFSFMHGEQPEKQS